MEETRWWTRLLLISAVLAVVLLLAGPLGYKFELSGLQPSFLGLLVGVVGGAVVLVVSLVMMVVSIRKGLSRDRNLLLVAAIIATLPVLVMAPTIIKGRSVPPIHDITTNTDDPPMFSAILPIRAEAPNTAMYGDKTMPADKLAEMQRGAYPDLATLVSELTQAEAVARAGSVLADLGLEVVNTDEQRGLVEATATTFWFGFKDDVVVRVRPDGSGTLVDVRSVSRVGVSDLGANADRIRAFVKAFEG